MNYILLTLACSICTAIFANEPHNFYNITIKLPSSVAPNTHIPAYYKGNRLDLHEGWTRIPECGNPCMFSLLITEDIEFTTKGNTVNYLKRIPEQPYSWYDITLTLCKQHNADTSIPQDSATPSETSYTWDIEENNQEAPERIPEHTIVLLANPHFIESIKAQPHLPGSLGTITFKQDLDKKQFEESMLSVLVGTALHLNAIHTKDKPVCAIKTENVIISLAQ